MSNLAVLEDLARKAKEQYRDQIIHLQLLDTMMDINPLPCWIKQAEYDSSGQLVMRMLRINKAYEARWGLFKSVYEGRTDIEVWGDEIGQQFIENDRKALEAYPEPFYTVERVPDRAHGEHTSPVPVWRIGKVASQLGEKSYVLGVAWREDQTSLQLFGGGRDP